MSTKRLFVVGLVVALLIAGVASYYASAQPDGLNYVAEKTGFIDAQETSPTDGGPLAGYETKGVDNPRLSGGLAGALGVLIVLLLAGGLAHVVRRRDPVSTE